MSRILPGMTGTVKAIRPSSDDAPENPFEHDRLQARLGHLQTMLEAGLDEYAATLTFVPGIGVKWAKRLVSLGLHDLEDLAQADAYLLTAHLPVSETRALKWIKEAMTRLSDEVLLDVRDLPQGVEVAQSALGTDLDPYRLKRSLELTVDEVAPQRYRVTGGQDPHIVVHMPQGISCDCPDHAKGNVCKHILAVRRVEGDSELHSTLSRVDAFGSESGLNLSSLWMARHG